MFPPVLSIGLPVRHHIVVYYQAKAKEDRQTLQKRLILDKDELDASAWLDHATIVEVVQSDDFGQSRPVPQRYIKLVAWNGSYSTQVWPLGLQLVSKQVLFIRAATRSVDACVVVQKLLQRCLWDAASGTGAEQINESMSYWVKILQCAWKSHKMFLSPTWQSHCAWKWPESWEKSSSFNPDVYHASHVWRWTGVEPGATLHRDEVRFRTIG